MTATPTSSELPNVDLDAVAAGIWSRIETWTRAGLDVSALTWRDARASWPQPLPTERAEVIEPESVGVIVRATDGRSVELVLWRGGWTDGFLHTTACSVPLMADVTDFTDVASCLRMVDESIELLTG